MTALAPALSVRRVGKSFGALRVLDDVSFELAAGETLGMIGPNGAGKTTLFNIICGFTQPDTGGVACFGRAITGLPPERRALAGLARTFQKSLLFPELGVRETIALARRARAGAGYAWWGGRRAVAEADAFADALIAGGDLAGRGDVPARDLSYGERRMLDVLATLALEPRVLLLDEPTAGLTRQEGARLLDLVGREKGKMAVVLIAHDLDIIFAHCDRIAVLDLGRLVALGTPETVRTDPRVLAAYLGTAAAPTS